MTQGTTGRIACSLFFSLGALLVSPACQGQAFFLWRGSIEAEGHVVANVRQVRVHASFETATDAAMVFEDHALRIEGTVSIAGTEASISGSHLAVGVGEPVGLRSTRGWRIAMLPGTWAPVIGGGRREIRIALPEGFPVSTARLRMPVAPSASDPTDEPWSWEEDVMDAMARDDLQNRVVAGVCVAERLWPRIGARTSWEPEWLRGETIRGFGRNGMWVRVRGYSKGFAINGVRKRVRCTFSRWGQDTAIGSDPCNVLHGDGCDPGGRKLWLEPGTAIYSTPQSSEPFALIKQRLSAIGRLPVTSPVDCLRCVGQETIVDVPRAADPSLPPMGRLSIEHRSGRGVVWLTGYVKVAAGSLVEAGSVPCRLVGFHGSSWGNWPLSQVSSDS